MSSEIVDALQDVEQAVRRVERAVKDRWSTVQAIGIMSVLLLVFSWFDGIWHSKWRYALMYSVSPDKVYIQDHPHDCAFLAAPLGEKYCHYDRTLATLRWATSTTGGPISSDDEGKTWTVFAPDAGVTVPKYSTVEEVYVRWEKTDD